jgi:hypothetical protein
MPCHSYGLLQQGPASSEYPNNDDDAKKARKSFPAKGPGNYSAEFGIPAIGG